MRGANPTRRPAFHPSLPAILFFLLALLIPAFEADSLVGADGDPARHVRHGQEILARGDVTRADPFSFTRPGEPFVGFEYGSQLLLAGAHEIGGTAGMAILAGLVIAGTLALLLSGLLRRGLDPLLAVTTVLVVTVLTNIHWLARPHILSWPLMLSLLTMLERERRPPLWAFGLLFALWTNLHGGWVYGWVLIGMYLVGHGLETLEVRGCPRSWARVKGLAAALGVSVAATLVNPYGWRLPAHVVEFFRDPWLRTLTQEFQSPDFHSPDLYPFLAAVLGVLLFLAFRPRLRWTHLVVLVGNLGMAFLSQRNIIQFALLSVPLLAIDLSEPWDRVVGHRPFARRFARNARAGATLPYLLLTLVFSGLLAVNHGRVAGTALVADGFRPDRFPVEAVAHAREAGLEGRLFHEFIWGGYLLYAWPETKVFIDGGTDFYGGDLLRAHRHVINLLPGWADSLDAWRIELALVPTEGAFGQQLLREPDWLIWHCDSTAMMAVRRGHPMTPPDPLPRSRCGR